jgi:hypothetical protein
VDFPELVTLITLIGIGIPGMLMNARRLRGQFDDAQYKVSSDVVAQHGMFNSCENSSRKDTAETKFPTNAKKDLASFA